MADVVPTPETWRAVDRYLADTLVGHDPALEATVAAQRDAGLPPIEVAPVSGKLLHLLVRIARAARVLEIGTLGGYSTIWLARGVAANAAVDAAAEARADTPGVPASAPPVVTIEAEPVNAAVARRSLDAAGVGSMVDIRVGRAADVLPTLAGDEPFDLVFIDADKQSNTVYLDWAARLGRPGTVVVVDNVCRAGRVADASSDDALVQGVQRGLRMLADDPRFEATALQTLDAKGWDGLAVAIVV